MKLPRAVTLALTLIAGATAHAGERLDCVARPRLLDTRFARYGHAPARSIQREARGIRLRLPADPKGAAQTGLYSYVSLGGDFEITVTYEWLAVPAPKTGYGVSSGVAVEALGAGGTLALARAHLPDKGDGYAVTRGEARDGGIQYETTHYPTKARTGRLVVQREKQELICLAADSVKGPLNELCRVPFTNATVRQVRLFADPGGSPTTVDVRLGQLCIEAEKITGGEPLHEQGSSIGWWIAAGAVSAGGVVAGMVWWRRRRA